MKKSVFIIITMIALLAITACVGPNAQFNEVAEGLKAIKNEDVFEVYSTQAYQAIEILFYKEHVKDFDGIVVNKRLLKLAKETEEGLILSLVNPDGKIESSEFLFSISSIEDKHIKEVKILYEKPVERATLPLSNGISLLDTTVNPNQPFELYIYSKGVSDLRAVEFTVNFDPSRIIVDPAFPENFIQRFGAVINSLMIKEKTNNTITISIVFQNPVNISEELSFKLKMRALGQTASSNVWFSDITALDGEGSSMDVDFFPGIVTISSSLTPKFLGDFNNDNEIGLMDFSLFAQKYGSSVSDGIYTDSYDIGPAQDRFKGDWAGIYDVANPDGKVNIIDFVVFTNNYGRTKPASYNQPPSAPTGPSPINNSENTSLSPTLSWIPSVDPDSDAIVYDVYVDTNPAPTTLRSSVSASTYALSGLLNATTYYWKVVARDTYSNTTSSNVWRFTTLSQSNNPPSAPTNPTPAHESQAQETSLTLSWDASTDPEGGTVYYDLYFGTQVNPTLMVSNLTSTQYPITSLLNNTLYHWKVVAKDAQTNSTPGQVWNFRTKQSGNNPPTKPQNPQPASGNTNKNTTLTLSWDPSTDPDSDPVTYEVYLSTNPNPTTLRNTVTSPSFSISGLSYSTKYYWKIIAKDNNSGATSSDIWNFNTKAAPSGNPNYKGLTLGLTDYGGTNDLSATDDDADEIKITFENLTNAFTIQKQTGTVIKSQIQTWINSYVSSSSSKDVFLFHYSGHGYYESNQSRLYLSDGSNISMSELRTYLDAINGTKIVLIDACESGNFTSLSSGRQMSRAQRIEQMELFKQGVIEAFEESAGERGSFDSQYEYYVLTGSAIEEFSNEDGYLNHGFFTFFFNDGLGNVGESNPTAAFDYTYNADGYGTGGVVDGAITFRELYNYSKDKVQNYIQSKYGETQTVQGNHKTSDFVVGTYSSSQNNPPSSPSNPTPSSGALNVSTSQSLSWTSNGATSYDVYFGTASNPPKVSSNQSYSNYNPGTLSQNQKYYWKIVAKNAYGTTTGSVWSFTTQAGQQTTGEGRVILRNQTPQVTGNMEFDYIDAYFDTQNQNPPHWIVENSGSVFFEFDGAHDFSFRAYGIKEWNEDAEVDIYINGEYVYYGIIDSSWGVYTIGAEDFSSGKNEVEIWVYWGQVYIDEAWTGQGQVQNDPPSVPSNPNPSNGTSITDRTPQLSWASNGATSYDVYFGTSSTPPKVSSNQSNSTYSPSTLSVGQTYYWKITAKNAHGSTPGSLWSFSVISDSPQGGVDFTSPYSGNYLLINNESLNPDQTQYTGTLASASRKDSRRQNEPIPKGLPLNAYMMDPVPNRELKLDRSLLTSRVEVDNRAIGDTRQFTVYNFKTASDESLTATLQAQGTHCKIWVESTAQITTAKAQQVANEFDNVIYDQITQNFYTPSDVNSDGKIAILIFDIKDDFDTTGGYTGGYFWSRDLFDMAGSNRMEIFYIDTYPSMHYPKSNPIDVSKAFSTLAHEFQHMVNFNRNYIVEGSDWMPTWIDEGLSMAAERLVYGPSVVNSRVSYYNASPGIRNGHSLLYWDDSGETLANYSLSYVFMQYFRIQMARGEGIYKEIIMDYANDYRCIQNALDQYASSIPLGDFLTNWRIAMAINEPTGVYGFKGDSSFVSIQTPLYTGGNKNLRGGGALLKTLSGAFTDPGNSGADIQYVGLP